MSSADRPQRTAPTRRALLTGALGTLGMITLSACGQRTPDRRDPGQLEPVLASASYLLARYDQVIAAVPGLAERLTPLRADHQAHVDALARELGVAEQGTRPTPRPPAGGPDPSASASAAAATSAAPAQPTDPPVPTDSAAAVRQLRGFEQEGQREASRACLTAQWYHAALLGSIAAARASHAEALT